MNRNASQATAFFTVTALAAAAFIGACTSAPTPNPSSISDGRGASMDYYPPSAKRQGLTGRVGLECTCDSDGRAHNIVVVDSAGPLLDDGAMRLVSASHCTPGDPPNSVGRMGVIFNLTNKPPVPPFQDHRPTIIVTGSALPGT
jgi:TonB family protein